MMVDYRPPGPFNVPHRKPVTGPNLRPLTQITPDHNNYSSSPSSNAASQRNNPYAAAFPARTTSVQAPQVVHSQTHQQIQPMTSSSSPASQPYNNAMFTSRRTPSQSTSTSTTYTNNNNNYNNNNNNNHTTTTTTTSYTYPTPSRTPSNVSSSTSKISQISRTSSTRSVITPPSYVALMRKQKATVWCDRAQPEDPRITAQHKLAKQRATRELTTANAAKGKTLALASDSRSSTNSGSMGSGSLGVRSKIRHHIPKDKGLGFGSGNLMGMGVGGAGVPMRLSANEVGDEGTYNASSAGSGGAAGSIGSGTGNVGGGSGNGGGPPVPHKRNSSLQSSNTGRERDSKFLTVDTAPSNRRFSSGSGSGSVSAISSSTHDFKNHIPELDETPVPESHGHMGGSMGSHSGSYFDPNNTSGGKSAGGSSSERENSFGVVGSMGGPTTTGNRGSSGAFSGGGSGALGGGGPGAMGGGASHSVVGSRARANSGKKATAEDLKRRGSVDERGLFPQGLTGRLVIANPDVDSDSD